MIQVLQSLDRVRAASLGLVLRGRPRLARLYRSRPRRLLLLYFFSLIFSLGVALLAPLWALFLGPMIYGFPHLLQSARYSSELVASPARFMRGLAVLFALLASLRLLQDFGPTLISLNEPFPSAWEAFSLLALCLWAFVCGRGRTWGAREAMGLVLAGVFLALTWSYPLIVLGALILVHNAVAFAVWVRLAPAGADRRVALGASLVFCAVTAAILGGVFAPIYQIYRPALNLSFVGLELHSVGQGIFPWSSDGRFLSRAVVAYAFGQSQHYFVWMKALPDVRHAPPTPPSFVASYRGASALLAPGALRWVFSMAGVAVIVCLCLSWPQARAMYFAVASLHGYWEISALLAAPPATV